MTWSPLRELTAADAETVAALFRAAWGDARPVDAEEIRAWVRNDELRPENLRVLELDGRVAGYGDIWIEDDEIALDLAAPGHEDVFLDWLEGEARATGKHARVYLPSEHELVALLDARGYRLWRSSYTMEIELDRRPDESPLPEGIELRTYGDADAEAVRLALNEAFAGDPFWHEVSPSNFREFYLRRRGYDPALWLLAWAGADPAGSVLAFTQDGGDAERGWVSTLSVRAPYRRRGLGEALLRAAFGRLYDRGLRRVGLGVDAENVTGAVGLYERAGMRPVRRNDNWVLDL